MHELKKRIEEKSAKIAVIGLGYVGLPVACEFANAGFDVLGVDLLAERVATINRGESPIEGDEPGLNELLNEVIGEGRLKATTDYEDLRDRDVVLIDVETPVDENNIPQYRALRGALASLGHVLKEGALVIVESTIAPGTITSLVVPQLGSSSGKKLNEGFYIGNCPERVMPGKLLHNLRNLSRVLGGMTPETAETMRSLYSHVVNAELDLTDCLTAELVKTAENAYRDVQIAFANELALICEGVGGDVWKVRELVNKSPGRNVHYPGAGVGGHCIPKDPWLLAYGVREKETQLKVIPAARMVNESMPGHIRDLALSMLAEAGVDAQAATVLVMGYAYLEDSDDTRHSPTAALLPLSEAAGLTVRVHDPFVADYQGDLLELAKGADMAILMVKHSEYKQADLSALKNAMRHALFIDGRGFYQDGELEKAGFTSWVIGVGR